MTRRGTCGRCGLLVDLDELMRVKQHRKLGRHDEWCPGAGRRSLEDAQLIRPAAALGGAL